MDEFMPQADRSGNGTIQITQVDASEQTLRVSLEVMEEAVYEINLISEQLQACQKKYFQLQEGSVQLVLPVSIPAAGRYALRVGRLQDWSTCLFCY